MNGVVPAGGPDKLHTPAAVYGKAPSQGIDGRGISVLFGRKSPSLALDKVTKTILMEITHNLVLMPCLRTLLVARMEYGLVRCFIPGMAYSAGELVHHHQQVRWNFSKELRQ